MEHEKKTLRLKPKTIVVGEEAQPLKRPAKKRIVRREDIPSEKLTTARPPRTTLPQRQPPKKLTPGEQQAVDLTDRLVETFEVWRNYKPLALGIEKALIQHFTEQNITISKRVLHRVLWHHTHQKEYLQQIIAHAHRYDLDGTANGDIKPTEKEHAQRTLEGIAVASAAKQPARADRPHRPSPRQMR